MGEGTGMGLVRLLLIWTLALTVTLAGFYGLDHLTMGMQGLPLNWDLTPTQ